MLNRNFRNIKPYLISIVLNLLFSLISWIPYVEYAFITGSDSLALALSKRTLMSVMSDMIITYIAMIVMNLIVAKILEKYNYNKLIYWSVTLLIALYPYLYFVITIWDIKYPLFNFLHIPIIM